MKIFLQKDSEHVPNLGHILTPGSILLVRRRGHSDWATYLTKGRRSVPPEGKGRGVLWQWSNSHYIHLFQNLQWYQPTFPPKSWMWHRAETEAVCSNKRTANHPDYSSNCLMMITSAIYQGILKYIILFTFLKKRYVWSPLDLWTEEHPSGLTGCFSHSINIYWTPTNGQTLC